MLGIMHTYGFETVKQNGTKAREYFLKSISKDSKLGYSGLAYLYLNGIDMPVNIPLAIKYFEMAGDAESMSNIGAIYSNGMGEIKANNSLAIQYFKYAAN